MTWVFFYNGRIKGVAHWRRTTKKIMIAPAMLIGFADSKPAK
jgi:hypothetical protein